MTWLDWFNYEIDFIEWFPAEKRKSPMRTVAVLHMIGIAFLFAGTLFSFLRAD